jgi:hypothetical protein
MQRCVVNELGTARPGSGKERCGLSSPERKLVLAEPELEPEP